MSTRNKSLVLVRALALPAFALSMMVGCGDGAASAAGAGTDTPAGKGGLVGESAPEVKATAVTGDGPATIADAAGKVVIVDFWATYCAPCKKSFPKYQELVDQFSGELAVIAVSVDDVDDVSEDDLKEFANATGVKFAIVWDREQATANTYKPPKMPTSYVIDREGIVRHVHAGYESGEEAKIADEVRALLAK